MRRLACPASGLARLEALERILAVVRDRRECLLPGAELRLARRGPQPPVPPVMRLDPVLGTKGADAVDGLGRGARKADSLVAAADLLQRSELRPPGEDEATVAAARARAADVGLDEHDVERGVV